MIRAFDNLTNHFSNLVGVEEGIPTHGGVNPEAQTQEEPSSRSSEEPLESKLSELSSDYAGGAGPSLGEKGKKRADPSEISESGDIAHPGGTVGSPTTSVSRGGFENANKGYAELNVTHLEGQSSVSDKLSAKDQKRAQFQEALKNDTGDKLFTSAEKALIEKHKLQYEHHNANSIYLTAPAEQEGRTLAEDSNYWYRTMGQGEFDQLKKKGEMPPNDSFGGIATNRRYPTDKYMGNDKDGKYTVEFKSPGLAQKMKEEGKIEPKGEGDGGTFGLGEKGTNPPTSGGKDLRNSLDIFNEYTNTTNSKVVDLKLDNRGYPPIGNPE
jgi:hypothetical protein